MPRKKPPTVGRPALPEKEVLGYQVSTRVNAAECHRINIAALKAKMSVSAWVRETLGEAVKR